MALRDVTFECAEGEITCLIGPSGCGKTTLLRLVAGLIQPHSGSIELEGNALASPEQMMSPEKRPVGLVFQEGALFPHMTVAQNVGFGLRSEERKTRVPELLEQVGLQDYAGRYPDSLSGGQRQRVALIRAIAPGPKVLLFDEPYANLDVQRRRSLREDARRMIRDNQMIGIFVTHDPDEVMAIADHVVVLDQGLVEQRGLPQDLYDAPQTLRVAELFGDSQTLSATLSKDGLQTPFGLWSRDCLANSDVEDGAVSAVIRADQLELRAADDGLAINEVRAAGGADDIWLRSPDSELRLRLRLAGGVRSNFATGDVVIVEPLSGSVFTAPA